MSSSRICFFWKNLDRLWISSEFVAQSLNFVWKCLAFFAVKALPFKHLSGNLGENGAGPALLPAPRRPDLILDLIRGRVFPLPVFRNAAQGTIRPAPRTVCRSPEISSPVHGRQRPFSRVVFLGRQCHEIWFPFGRSGLIGPGEAFATGSPAAMMAPGPPDRDTLYPVAQRGGPARPAQPASRLAAARPLGAARKL